MCVRAAGLSGWPRVVPTCPRPLRTPALALSRFRAPLSLLGEKRAARGAAATTKREQNETEREGGEGARARARARARERERETGMMRGLGLSSSRVELV
eukprot:360109-Chlamydomonas_euryale.AAC.3